MKWTLFGIVILLITFAVAPSIKAQTFACPCSFWDNSAIPTTASHPDTNTVEVGIRFKSTVNGQITGLKFYKGALNTGIHTGNLWSSTGQLLATGTFINEAQSGWQQLIFPNPINITPDTIYTASYFTPTGYYSVTRSYFNADYARTPLIGISTTSGGNGVYRYGTSSGFPTNTFQATNYWVDVIFTTASTPIPTGTLSPTPTLPLTPTPFLTPTPTTLPTSSPTLTPSPSASPTPSMGPTPTPGPPPTCAQNPVLCENTLTGNPSSEWDITGSGSSNIQGFATEISVNKGEVVNFKVKTDSPNYRVDIYRVGYYGGLGARKITTLTPLVVLPQSQPTCLSDTSTGLVDCGNWTNSFSWQTPSNSVSGVYIAKLVRQDGTSGSNHIVFVVRDDTNHSDILFQTSDATWQAYNTYGGNSLYSGSPDGRAYKVSYNRPFTTRGASCCSGSIESWFFSTEYPMIRWLEANGYNVSYFTNVDTARRGLELLEHKAFLSVGHDEYWSRSMRNNVEFARNSGVHLAFFSGNEIFWKTRWENSIDGTSSPFKTLVSYKETKSNAKIDPTTEWTGTWRDPRFSPPSDGGQPENALTGTLFMVNGVRNDPMTVPYAYSRMRLWRNTSVADLTAGQTTNFAAGMLGYEWDAAVDNGYAPAGLVKYSSTSLNVNPQYLLDEGNTFGDGVAIHSVTLYKHQSGALVFGAGTTQWSWGLDDIHDRSGTPADMRIRQATVNILADMTVQAASLQPGLVPASASIDIQAPVTSITSPVTGTNVQPGTSITVVGTSSDNKFVAGVELSIDGGNRWYQLPGRENWQYTWTPTSNGTYTIKVRAVDDSANLQSPVTMSTITVGTATPTPTPTSIPVVTPTFGPSSTPSPTPIPTLIPTQTPIPTLIPTPIPGTTQTIIFDDATGQNRKLTGEYPTGNINWGTTGVWWLSAPWQAFTTKSVSFTTNSIKTASFTFVTPKIMTSLTAYNGGTTSTDIKLDCSGNTSKTQTILSKQVATITTDWTTKCTTVTITSSNGWDTNFDNLVIK